MENPRRTLTGGQPRGSGDWNTRRISGNCDPRRSYGNWDPWRGSKTHGGAQKTGFHEGAQKTGTHRGALVQEHKAGHLDTHVRDLRKGHTRWQQQLEVSSWHCCSEAAWSIETVWCRLWCSQAVRSRLRDLVVALKQALGQQKKNLSQSLTAKPNEQNGSQKAHAGAREQVGGVPVEDFPDPGGGSARHRTQRLLA
ncbi:hypothetical protein CRENBAI_013346, partial [Crenichthys baileyi]